MTALRRTLGAACDAARDRSARAGLLEALAGVRWVLAERRPVPRWLEVSLRELDA
jgi:hypothetical protein